MGSDRKRISTGGRTDRLSDLPCNVIGQILSLLPLKEAAKTSVLSKTWEDKWLTIPHLVFDRRISESTIYQVLLLHKEPIVKFAIEHARRGLSQTALYHWFNFLSNHRIEELRIMLKYSYLNNDEPLHVIPNHLFSFYNLKHLSLQHVEVRVPSIYNGFSNLISIDFEDVDTKVEELQRLVEKCPKLESLSLVNYYNEIANSNLYICTPHHNLKSFKFRGTVEYIYINSNARLEDVSICYGRGSMYTVPGHVTELDYAIKLFGELSLIKKLEVNYYFLEVLGETVPPKLPKSLSRLQHIQFEKICFGGVNNLESVLCLIRSSPNLRTLLIRNEDEGNDYEDEDAAIPYLKEKQKSTIPLSSSLKEVKFECIYGLPAEMEFVKLLLLGAKELRKIQIDQIDGQDKLSIVRELASFPRASSQAVILTGK